MLGNFQHSVNVCFLGNLLVSLCCIVSLTSNMSNLNVVLGQFSFQTIIMVCNSHNLLMMINKWIQACMASSGTSTVSAPVRYIFFTFLFVVWSINLGKWYVHIFDPILDKVKLDFGIRYSSFWTCPNFWIFRRE